MLDIKYIREHEDEVKRNCANRCVDVDIDALLALDRERLEAIRDVEELRRQRNDIAAKMATAIEEQRPGLIEKGRGLKNLLSVKEADLADIEQRWLNLLLRVPNRTHPDVPLGETDHHNVVVRSHLEPRVIQGAKDHVEIAEANDLIDFERAAKVVGNKFYYLKGRLALLEQALIRFALDEVMEQGFLPMTTPDLANDDIIVGAGFSPRGNESQIYSIEDEPISLIGTAEITVAGYHENETLNAADLPLRYAAMSHCFRTEAGAYGRESYGLYRVHQFSKVELFLFTEANQSDAMLEELVRIEENIWQKFGIPYRIMDICTGDLGAPAYRKYDIEAWMPGKSAGAERDRGAYGEVTSASNCTDYQARRLGIKVKRKDGSIAYAHTLNGTAIATSRTLLAILENYQQADGSIRVPDVLIPYCGFAKLA